MQTDQRTNLESSVDELADKGIQRYLDWQTDENLQRMLGMLETFEGQCVKDLVVTPWSNKLNDMQVDYLTGVVCRIKTAIGSKILALSRS